MFCLGAWQISSKRNYVTSDYAEVSVELEKSKVTDPPPQEGFIKRAALAQISTRMPVHDPRDETDWNPKCGVGGIVRHQRCLCKAPGSVCFGPNCSTAHEILPKTAHKFHDPLTTGFVLADCKCHCKCSYNDLDISGFEGIAASLSSTRALAALPPPLPVKAGVKPGRYILWVNGVEGMGSWRWSLAQMLELARQTSRQLILPCVAGGQLVPCWRKNTPYPLSTYIDVDELRTGFPGIVLTWQEFETDYVAPRGGRISLAKNTNSTFCMHPSYLGVEGETTGFSCSSCPLCANGFGLFGRDNLALPVVTLWERDIAEIAQVFDEVGPVAIVTMFMRNAINFMKMDGRPALRNDDFGVFSHFKYSTEAYERADRIAKELGLANDYIAVHWRSEATGCNYTECSLELAKVVEKRLSMLDARKWPAPTEERLKFGMKRKLPKRQNRCLLVSDIPVVQENVLWTPFSSEFQVPGRKEEMQFALRILNSADSGLISRSQWRDHWENATGGCRKVDQVILPSSDQVQYSFFSYQAKYEIFICK